MDKSRAAGLSLNNQHSVSSRNNALGKSVEGLNTINQNNSTTNSNGNDENSFEWIDSNGEKYVYGDDDDESDDVEVKGCFPFKRADDSYMKRKKHSLDSRMNEQHHTQLVNDENRLPIIIASQSLSPNNTYDDTEHNRSNNDNDNSHNNSNNNSSSNSNSFELCKRNLDDVPYDRVFYRTIQKSLDDIFSRDDYAEQLVASQKSRNSKSSGDLTMYNEDDDEIYGPHFFPRFQSESQFNRECFFARHSSDESDPNHSIHSNSSYQNKNDSRKSSEFPLINNSFGSLSINDNTVPVINNNNNNDDSTSTNHSHINRGYDDRTNSICSDHSSIDSSITPSASRKSSVTFRVDTTTSSIGTMSSANSQLFYANIDAKQPIDLVSDLTERFLPKNQRHQSYAVIAHRSTHLSPLHQQTKLVVKAGSVPMKKDKKSAFEPFARLFKFPKHNYNKFENKNDMKEQLLIDEKTQSNNAAHDNESQYDAVYRTKNFVLAKQND